MIDNTINYSKLNIGDPVKFTTKNHDNAHRIFKIVKKHKSFSSDTNSVWFLEASTYNNKIIKTIGSDSNLELAW